MVDDVACLKAGKELLHISLTSSPVNDPDHILIELLPGLTLVSAQKGILKLKNDSSFSLHVGDVLFAILW
jgi:hypothetical protein